MGIINCVYKIANISSPTPILSKEFNKETKINILINTEKYDYLKEYQFSEIGNYNISFLFYDNIKMNYMFKDISSLIEVDMISNNNLSINSMQGTFENCSNLISFDIKGFNIKELKSLHKLFYHT